jgi:hypothetical protein
MLLELLQHEPCHIGALQQLSAIAQQTGQAETAASMLHRVLWAHEASYAPGFVACWLRGEARLRHAHPPNRPFFRALHKHAVALSRRGLHRAAVACATLLLSLERSDPTKIRLWLDILVLRATKPHLLWLHQLDDPDACVRLPGWAFSYAIALRELEASPPPATVAAATPASPPPWASGSATSHLRTALLTFPGMLPTALQACASGSSSATQLSARWQKMLTEGVIMVGGNIALAHLEALYWERGSELWATTPDRLNWLQQTAKDVLDELDALRIGASAAPKTAADCGDSVRNVQDEAKAACERRERWYPSGSGGNPFRGLEYTLLRADHVVIPEEEEAQQQPPQPPPQPPPEEGGEVPREGNNPAVAAAPATSGGCGALALAPMLEEAEALQSRLDEMERLTRGGGAAPHLKPLLAQRLKALDERLTIQMINIDGVDASSDEAREAKRALTRRMDELCARVAAIDVGP